MWLDILKNITYMYSIPPSYHGDHYIPEYEWYIHVVPMLYFVAESSSRCAGHAGKWTSMYRPTVDVDQGTNVLTHSQIGFSLVRKTGKNQDLSMKQWEDHGKSGCDLPNMGIQASSTWIFQDQKVGFSYPKTWLWLKAGCPQFQSLRLTWQGSGTPNLLHGFVKIDGL